MRRLVPCLFVLGSSIASVMIACSSGSTMPHAAPIPFNQLGQRVTESICSGIAQCCSANGFDEEYKTCASSAAALQARYDQQKAEHPEWVYDEQKAGDCIAKLTSRLSSCGEADVDQYEYAADCNSTWHGSVPLGGECESSSDCEPPPGAISRCTGFTTGGTADGGVSRTKGKCIAIKEPVEGDPCLATYNAPERVDIVYGNCTFSSKDLYCDATAKTCKKRSSEGSSCATPQSSMGTQDLCADGLYCDSTTVTCKPRPRVGEKCSPIGTCADGAYCGPERTCKALEPAGAACGEGIATCLHGCDAETKKCRTNDVSRKQCANGGNSL